jgi:hypothetical protein
MAICQVQTPAVVQEFETACKLPKIVSPEETVTRGECDNAPDVFTYHTAADQKLPPPPGCGPHPSTG